MGKNPYRLSKQVEADPADRRAFDALATQVFGLSFEEWHKAGYWTGRYLPYTLFDGSRAVANVSVNRMSFCYAGRRREYIQLGTVMTAPGYRGQGLGRFLMETVLDEWAPRCDGFYLFANKSALDFYPKFGFSRMPQHQTALPVVPRPGRARKMEWNSERDRALLWERYRQGSPFCAFPMLDQFPLLMFYGTGPLRDAMYDLPALGVSAVVEQEGDTLCCLGLFGKTSASLTQVLSALAPAGTRRAVLGFPPFKQEPGFSTAPVPEQEDTLFVRGRDLAFFHKSPLLFPLLSHA